MFTQVANTVVCERQSSVVFKTTCLSKLQGGHVWLHITVLHTVQR